MVLLSWMVPIIRIDELRRLYEEVSDEFDELKVSGIIGGFIGDLA